MNAGPRSTELPFHDPLQDRPQTAQRILRAARSLLEEDGYQAVTFRNIVARAGVNKSSIRFHFANKAELMTAVVDSLIHDDWLRLKEELPGGDWHELVGAMLQAKARWIKSTKNFGPFFDVLPHAMREDALKDRLAALYRQWFSENMRLLGIADAAAADPDHDLAGLGELMSAVVDGISVQAGLAGPDYDIGRPLRAFGFLLENAEPDRAAR